MFWGLRVGRGRQGTTDRRNIRKLQIVLKLVMHIFITYLSIYILISITNDMSFRKKNKKKNNWFMFILCCR